MTGSMDFRRKGDVRMLKPLEAGEVVIYGSNLCDVTDVREDENGGVQITLQARQQGHTEPRA